MSNEVHNWLNTLMLVVVLAAVVDGIVLALAVGAMALIVFKGLYDQIKHDAEEPSQTERPVA